MSERLKTNKTENAENMWNFARILNQAKIWKFPILEWDDSPEDWYTQIDFDSYI